MSQISLPRVVRGGGYTLHTADPVVIALVRRIADLEAELAEARSRAGRRAKVKPLDPSKYPPDETLEQATQRVAGDQIRYGVAEDESDITHLATIETIGRAQQEREEVLIAQDRDDEEGAAVDAAEQADTSRALARLEAMSATAGALSFEQGFAAAAQFLRQMADEAEAVPRAAEGLTLPEALRKAAAAIQPAGVDAPAPASLPEL